MTVLKEFGRKVWGCVVSGEVFIETGTGFGDSLLAATQWRGTNPSWRFDTLHSIEVSMDSILIAREKVNRERLGGQQVIIHHGNSVDVLPTIIDPLKRTVFWLDAHEPYCPLLDELRIILKAPWRVKPVILIDDYAAFMSAEKWQLKYGSYNTLRWPKWGEIYDLMGGVDYKWNFLAADDGILYCW